LAVYLLLSQSYSNNTRISLISNSQFTTKENKYLMARLIHCVKLDSEAEGLDRPPYPGELGQRIFENISKDAWQSWMQHQTMLINENRLSVIDPKDREFLEKEMENFLFGDGSEIPEGFTPPSK